MSHYLGFKELHPPPSPSITHSCDVLPGDFPELTSVKTLYDGLPVSFKSPLCTDPYCMIKQSPALNSIFFTVSVLIALAVCENSAIQMVFFSERPRKAEKPFPNPGLSLPSMVVTSFLFASTCHD